MEYFIYDEEWSMEMGERYVLAWYLKSPYGMINTIIFCLYDEESSTYFRMEWFSMAYRIYHNGHMFNWETILSFNIAWHRQDPKSMNNIYIYMWAYLIDVVCTKKSFLAFN